MQIQQLTEELTKAKAVAAKDSSEDQQLTQRKLQQLRIQVNASFCAMCRRTSHAQATTSVSQRNGNFGTFTSLLHGCTDSDANSSRSLAQGHAETVGAFVTRKWNQWHKINTASTRLQRAPRDAGRGGGLVCNSFGDCFTGGIGPRV